MGKSSNNMRPLAMTISITNQADIEACTSDDLAAWLSEANKLYRKGEDAPSDALYDAAKTRLQSLAPEHEYLATVEAEPDFGAGKVTHGKPMLSLEKVYTEDEVNKYIARVVRAATELGIEPESLEFQLTSKLDGIAAKRENGVWATRGDGLIGNDISNCLAKGVRLIGDGAGTLIGEIVMLKSYAQQVGIDDARARNVVGGILSADSPRDIGKQALDAGVIHFVTFQQTQSHLLKGTKWASQVEHIEKQLQENEAYPTDGIVITIDNESIRQHMGENSKEPRYSVAKKSQGEATIVKVTGVTWQLGRTGVMTPVIRYEPTLIGGVTNSKATGHNAASLLNQGIGRGAKVAIVRAGSVIPYVKQTILPVEVEIPIECPCCGSSTQWSINGAGERVTINCTNKVDCPDQLSARIEHFFKTIEVKNFGGSACKKLVEAGFDTPMKVYAASLKELQNVGFGPKQAENLLTELEDSRKRPLQDFKLLAAFGIHLLGRGDGKRILKHHHINDIFALTTTDLEAVEGFAEITSNSVVAEISHREGEIAEILSLGFNLDHTSETEISANGSESWHGKKVVFTGKLSLPREQMNTEAEQNGMVSQKTISSKTDWLVVGEKAGASKLGKAVKNGVQVLSEQEYREIVG